MFPNLLNDIFSYIKDTEGDSISFNVDGNSYKADLFNSRQREAENDFFVSMYFLNDNARQEYEGPNVPMTRVTHIGNVMFLLACKEKDDIGSSYILTHLARQIYEKMRGIALEGYNLIRFASFDFDFESQRQSREIATAEMQYQFRADTDDGEDYNDSPDLETVAGDIKI